MFYHALILSVLHFAVQEPNHLFQPMGKPVRVEKEEGESCILRCLLTDPRATDFSLRMENGTSIPPGMRYTADPRKGIEIHNLLPRYSADYVCRAWVNGVEKTSRIFSIEVFPKICSPPGVSLEMSEYVRIVGQSLEIVCSTHNPNTHYIVKWEHSSKNAIEKSTIEWDHKGTRITTVLTIPVVSMADTGNLTCVAHNEAGINRSTAFLHVVEEPYIRLSPRLHPKIIQNGTVVTLKEGEDMELGVMIEAYPPIQEWGWNMPGNHNASSIKKTFQAFNNRYEAALMLGRMTIGDQGQYRFYTWNAQVNSSTTFTVEIYQKPVTRVRLEGDATLTCISTGYPSPEAVWYQCSGLRTSCPKNDSELDPSITPKVEVERREHGLVKVRNMLTLTRASEKTTFECVASNVAGIGSDTFYMDVPCKAPPAASLTSTCYIKPCSHVFRPSWLFGFN